MDLFKYLPEYRVLVCLSCQFAIPPTSLKGHLRKHQGKHAVVLTAQQIDTVTKLMLCFDLLDPAKEPIAFPDPDSLQ
jgi:hypothetical protein